MKQSVYSKETVCFIIENTRQCHTRGEHQLYAIAVKTKNLRKKTCGGSL